ncbi:MAG TPA: hypothetical protein VJ798_01945 [Rhizomicrobium sp.]|nr:hypothetical protein [Rhizomicrobium sp.]
MTALDENNSMHDTQQGFDLVGYLNRHQGDIAAMLLIATLVTMSHWRHWFYPDALKLPDGSPDPRAGRFDARKALSDFFCVPALVVAGILILGFRPDFAFAAAFVALGAFVGSAFIFTTIEKARDGALGVVMQVLAGWLPGGRK